MNKMEDQDREIKELIKCVKESQTHSKDQFQTLVDQSNFYYSPFKSAITSTTERVEMILDQMKAIKTVTSREAKNA